MTYTDPGGESVTQTGGEKKSSRLEAATQNVKDNAPKSSTETKCAEDQPRNKVLPIVTPEKNGYYDEGVEHSPRVPEKDKMATVQLRIEEVNGNPAYQGSGTAEIVEGEATLHSDATGNVLLPNQISLDSLKEGVTAYVNGNGIGQVTVRLSLTPSDNPEINVTPIGTGNVEIRPVNVITPVLDEDELVLVHKDFAQPGQTALSELSVHFTQSHPGERPHDLAVQVDFGDQISCYHDVDQARQFNSTEQIANADLGEPVTLYMKGESEGDCTATARIIGSDGPGWRFADQVDQDIRVEELRLDTYVYTSGRTVAAAAQDNMVAAGNPKSRMLHQYDLDKFTNAKLVLRSPSDRFWEKADRVTITPHGHGLTVHSNDAATNDLPLLNQAVFAEGDYNLWAKHAPAEALDVEPAGRYTPAAQPGPTWQAWMPLKESTDRFVSCGAHTTNNKDRVHGDIIRLQTFSFEKWLDRTVHNASGDMVTAGVNLQHNCALAKAAHNKYYDKASHLPCVNHTRMAAGPTPWQAFVNAIHHGNTVEEAATEGTNFVYDHLESQGIDLSNRMLEAIRTYLQARVASGAGFAVNKATWEGKTPAQRMQATGYGLRSDRGLPGTHAEVLAVNQVWTEDYPKDQISVATYRVQPNQNQRKRFAACVNCTGILAGFNVITGITP